MILEIKSLDLDSVDDYLDKSSFWPHEVLKYSALLRSRMILKKSLDTDPCDDHLNQSSFRSL